MNAAIVPEPGVGFEIVDREKPTPAPDEVRIEVEACGVCHSDQLVVEGQHPAVEYPRVPGHEIAGRVDAVGEDVTEWNVGDRVGVGWHGGHCFTCEACRRGDFFACEEGRTTGIHSDGGYAEYMTAPHEAVAAIPESLDTLSAAPLLCAGITTHNALRNSNARPGDLVAVQGIGGLGHLGLQFAHEAGFETVALSRGTDKRDLAFDLGADHYVDTTHENPSEALTELGGASVILATAPVAKPIEALVPGLAPRGRLLIVGVPHEPIAVSPQDLIPGRREVAGWYSGTAIDSEETLAFSALRDVEPMVETYPLEAAADAYGAMADGDPRFRVVIEP